MGSVYLNHVDQGILVLNIFYSLVRAMLVSDVGFLISVAVGTEVVDSIKGSSIMVSRVPFIAPSVAL